MNLRIRGMSMAIVTAGTLVVPTRSAPAQMDFVAEARIQAWEDTLGALTCSGGCPGAPFCCPPKNTDVVE